MGWVRRWRQLVCFCFPFRPDLMVKKLRYYARFIVVSLLLNKVDLVKELIQELHHYVEEYVSVYEAEDDEEWRLVISEVTAFMEVSYAKACGPFVESSHNLFSIFQTEVSIVLQMTSISE